MSYLNKFQTHADYANETFVAPNVSACVEDGHVHYMGFPKTNGYDYVDLGLPSGTLWATCNVGASSPEEYGDYYAWGEITPKQTYTNENYRFYPGNNTDVYTKYSQYDNKMLLDLEDDAAHVVMGGDWHMPTLAQLNEMLDNTTSSITTYNGFYGKLFTSKNNGNSIFFPYAGMYFETGLTYEGELFSIWSKTRYGNNIDAYVLDSMASSTSSHIYYNRDGGLSVRGVIGELADNFNR